jgi:ribonuclease HI
MELTAVVRALEAVAPGCRVTVYTDSAGITERYQPEQHKTTRSFIVVRADGVRDDFSL